MSQVPADAEPVKGLALANLGINRTNLAWVTDYKGVLARIKKAGFIDLRLTLDEPYEKSFEVVKSAISDFGLRVLLDIPLSSKFFYKNNNNNVRPASDHLFEGRKLSDIDAELYKQLLSKLLAYLDEKRLSLSGLEIGNELNWADFNADFPVNTSDKTHGFLISKFELANSRYNGIIKGFEKYRTLIDVTRQQLLLSKFNEATPIVSAGLYDTQSKWAESIGASALRVPDTLAVLKEMGILDKVDVVGIHVYVKIGRSIMYEKEVVDLTSSKLKPCSNYKELSGKPCWITEWNVVEENAVTPSCNNNEAVEEAITFQHNRLKSFLSALGDPILAGAIQKTYIFSFDQGTQFSITTCGHTITRSEFFKP